MSLVKASDFAYEPVLRFYKALEIFDPVPYLIASYWRMRIPQKNHLSSPQRSLPSHRDGLAQLCRHKTLFLLALIRRTRDLTLRRAEYKLDNNNNNNNNKFSRSNVQPDEQRYPFVIAHVNESIPTPLQHVRLRCQDIRMMREKEYVHPIIRFSYCTACVW